MHEFIFVFIVWNKWDERKTLRLLRLQNISLK